MSSFLHKLKVGSVAIDNSQPPDITGVVTRRIQKMYVNDPVETLGLSLTDDAEVIGVDANSPSAKANIPLNFIIYDVNGEYVETKDDFYKVASNSLNLVVKLQSTTAIAEIIALILREEELAYDESDDAQQRSRLNLDELSRTTPRYSFLSMEHPLFTRYMKRLESRRDALNQIKQRTKEAQEEQRRLIRKRIEEEMKSMLDDNVETEANEVESNVNPNDINKHETSQNSNLSHISDLENLAMKTEVNSSETIREESVTDGATTEKEQRQNEETLESHIQTSNLRELEVEECEKISNDNEAFNQHFSADSRHSTEELHQEMFINNGKHEDSLKDNTMETTPQISAEELLALVGLPVEEQQQLETINDELRCMHHKKFDINDPIINSKVEFFTHPAEKYILSTGEEVICSIKERRGPIPSPPPGRPPKIRKI